MVHSPLQPQSRLAIQHQSRKLVSQTHHGCHPGIYIYIIYYASQIPAYITTQNCVLFISLKNPSFPLHLLFTSEASPDPASVQTHGPFGFQDLHLGFCPTDSRDQVTGSRSGFRTPSGSAGSPRSHVVRSKSREVGRVDLIVPG